MYKITVPLVVSTLCRSDLDQVVKELHRLDAERVLLSIEPIENAPKRMERYAELKKYCAYFKERGFEVGAWLWTFWYEGAQKVTYMRSVSGKEARPFVCPSDADYRRIVADDLIHIAQCGVDLILFDDDFRFTYLSEGICCACDNHLKEISRRVGEEVSQELLEQKLLYGGANPYRSAWLKTNESLMIQFAAEMRAAIDSVRPEVRLGYCCCIQAWDMDGADPIQIGKILAGKTKPLIRLIGAPYWAVHQNWGNRLQDVIELERLNKSLTVDDDFEILSEGDAFPRPRFTCPASYLEGFDTALRADGRFNGIMKYGIDYCSSVRYEKGYADRHVKNKHTYDQIEAYFTGMPVGVRVYESAQKYADAEIPKSIEGTHKIEEIVFPMAARMLAANAIPTVYEGDGICGIAFSENARHLPQSAFKNGLILDLSAAKILTANGIDVGLLEVDEEIHADTEYFIQQDEYANVVDACGCCAKLSENATIDSEFIVKRKRYPSSYFYENANGQKFFVFLFETYFADDHVWRSYARGIQLADAVFRLSGKRLPAVCHHHPDLYMLCKEDNGQLAVGLWNFHADEIETPKIQLAKEYGNIAFINCCGQLDKDTVTLSNIPPFAFAGIVLVDRK